MPLIGIKNELQTKDVQIIRVNGLPMSTTWNLIWQKTKNLSPASSTFLEYVALEKNKIIAQHFSWCSDFE